MAKVHIASAGAPLSDGLLQLQNGDAMDATLRPVTDQANTASPLELSTGLVSVSSTLQIATNDLQYIDAEDTGGNNRFTVSRSSGSQVVNVDFASNPTLGTDQVGAIRTYQDGVSLSDAMAFQKNGQVTFTERVKVEADSTSTTQSAAVIQSTTTNAGLVLQSNGTGATMAQIPDGTTTGGLARGQYATDWQKRRNSVDRVALGINSVVCGGIDNQAAGLNSVAIGGNNVRATNTASVAGGDQSVASGSQSICIGSESTASGSQSYAIGRQVLATASNSSSAGGSGNQAQAVYSRATGGGAQVKNAYARAWGAGFRANGDAAILNFSGRSQEGCAIIGFNSRLTGGANPPNLILSGALFYLRTGNGSDLANIKAWEPATTNQQFTFQLKLHATVTAITGTATGVNVGDVKQWNFEGSGKIVAGTLTILNATTTPVVLYEDAGLSTMSAQFIVGPSNTVGVEMTNATFVGGGELELMVNGYLYYQETALN